MAAGDFKSGGIPMTHRTPLWLALAAVAATLAACAGTKFERPASDQLVNGKTTYIDGTARLGAPRTQGSIVKNEKEVKIAAYAYADTTGAPVRQGVVPARGLTLFFADDVLVGHEYISSYRDDPTDFDDSRVAQIVKG